MYQVDSVATAGILTVNGVEATRFTGAQLTTGQVQFEHDGSENAPTRLQILVSDGNTQNGESGTVDLSFEFIARNDSPVLTTAETTVPENGSVLITNQNLLVTDPDLGFGNIVYHLAELPEHGILEVSGRGPLLSTAATFTQVELNSGLVIYTPQVNNSDDTTYQLLFVATDPEGASSNAVPLDVVVSGVNNTPTLATSALAVEEGGRVVLSGLNLSVSDPDSTSQEWVLSYRETPQMNGSISISNQSSQPASDGYHYFTYQDLVIGNVVYEHDGSEATTSEMVFRIGDGNSTSAEVSLAITVSPINDAPVLGVANDSITVDEGDQYVFRSTDFTFTDADAAIADMRVYFGFSDDVVGAITVAGASVNSFTLAELADAQVVYTHDGREPDLTATSDSFTFRLSDTQAESAPVVLTINITAQNDLPVFTFKPANELVVENMPGQVVGEIRYTDADSGDRVAFSVSDNRFVLTPLDENTVQIALSASGQLDFENDTRPDGNTMRLEITAVDSHPDIPRPVGYQGVQQEESLPVGDVNDAPVIDAQAVLTAVPGSGYTFDSSWVVDQDQNLDDLVFTATLSDGGVLPEWLIFNPQNRSFEVLDPESPDLVDINVLIQVDDMAGGITSIPIALLFSTVTELAPAQPVIEPVEIKPPEVLVTAGSTDTQSIDIFIEPFEAVPALAENNPFLEAREEFIATEESEAEAREESEAVESKKRGDDDVLNDELSEKVDLHDLIKPLASIANLQLAVIDTAFGGSSNGAGGPQMSQDMDMRDMNDIFSAAQAELEAQSALMARAMDSKEITQDARSAASRALFGTSTGISTGLSVGYLIWLVRGGTLMGSVMSSLPAWRFVDPLPVLGSLADDMENDDESLESIIDNNGKGKVSTVLNEAPAWGVRLTRVFSGRR